MNTLELADWIKNTEFYNNSDPNINDRMDEVEAMLRQQQAEIEALKAKTLTDEEIVRISETCDLNHVLGLIDFARAILKKASEK